FLGPRSENAEWVARQFELVLGAWFKWRRSLYPADGCAISPADQSDAEFARRQAVVEGLLRDLAVRFENEMPKHSPRYVGHMFSEISLPALLGHLVALVHNPNNISGESSRVGVKIEDEAVAALLAMVGFQPSRGAGHFTSGGTIANFEAL